ncbi:MAG: phosphoglucosamine mutase, partial [Clostridiales bacterium]
MTRKFGTDGVRGKAGTALTAELAYTLGLAAATALTTPGEQRPTIVIGKDTRISGDMLEAALAAGIAAAGVNVTLLGIIPTPGVAALMRILNADAGAVISASHNPYYDNGIKFFSRGGYKLPDSMENAIETMLKTPDTISRATGAHIGRIRSLENADQLYVDLLLQQQSPNLANMKIALDCANGAASFLAPPLLQKLGAEVIVIGNHPDGININHACGSTHLKSLQKLVINSHAHLGLAFDGDADRLLA